MSTLRSRAHEVFQKPPCDENRWVSFSEEYGCIVPFLPPGRDENDVFRRSFQSFIDYDREIKEEYGEEHFHGEKGVRLMLGLRMGLGWC